MWRGFNPPPLRIGRIVLVLILILTLRIHLVRFLQVVIPIIILEDHAVFQGFELSFGLEDSGVHSGLDGFPADFLQSSLFCDFGGGVGIFGRPTDVEDFVVIEGLTGHGLFGELSVVFVGIGYERYASVLEDADCTGSEETGEYPVHKIVMQIYVGSRLNTHSFRFHPIL